MYIGCLAKAKSPDSTSSISGLTSGTGDHESPMLKCTTVKPTPATIIKQSPKNCRGATSTGAKLASGAAHTYRPVRKMRTVTVGAL